MANIITKNTDPAVVPTPPAGKTAFGTNLTSQVFTKDDVGNVVVLTSGGTVTSVAASGSSGINVSGSPITTSGTLALSLANTAVTPGSYTNTNLTVDAQGRITAASNGSGATGTVTSVGIGSTDLTVSGSPITTSGAITLNLGTSGVTAGTYGSSSLVPVITVDAKGRVTSASTTAITAGVSSVFGRSGAVVAAEGDYTLTQLGDVAISTPATNQFLRYNGTTWVNETVTITGGTVTSVAATGSNGVSISGSPITTSGTITIGLGAITPTSVSATGTLTGSNLSGTNTGDQTLNSLLPSQSGNAGRMLGTNGTNASWVVGGSGSPAGSNTQVQFNNSGVFGASSDLAFDNDSVKQLRVGALLIENGGAGTSPTTIRGENGTTGSAITIQGGNATAGPQGGSVQIQSATATNSGGINIIAGDASGSGNLAGAIDIQAGGATSGATPNNGIRLRIGSTNRLVIAANGSLAVSGSTGASGQVLTSAGAGGPPTWATPVPLPPRLEEQVSTAGQSIFDTIVPTVANSGGRTTLMVFVNGVKQVEGASRSYTVTGTNQITFNNAQGPDALVEFVVFS